MPVRSESKSRICQPSEWPTFLQQLTWSARIGLANFPTQPCPGICQVLDCCTTSDAMEPRNLIQRKTTEAL